MSDVGKDVMSMGRMLRAGFDMHSTEKVHKCWMEHGGRLSKIDEDDPNSDAPLFYLKMKVQPIPENGENSKGVESERLVAPLSKDDEIRVGCEVEIAGLVKTETAAP